MKPENKSSNDYLLRLLIRANKLRQQGEHRGAISLYEEALAEDNASADICAAVAASYFVLAGSSDENGANFRAAVSWMEKAVVLAPSNSRYHADLGQYLWLGLLEYERASRAYRTALGINPNEMKALLGIAALYGVPEDIVSLEEAIASLQHAAELEPDDPILHLRLGRLWLEAKKIPKADREWTLALLCPVPLGIEYINLIESELHNRNS